MGMVVSILALLPWLLVGLLEKRKLRQFLSVAFFSSVLNIIALQLGEYMDWWVVYRSFPVLGTLPTFVFGFSPVVSLFVFYFTYPNMWLFLGVNLVLDATQAYIVGPLVFEKAGLYTMTGTGDTGLYLTLLSMVPLVYLYQLWYDKGKYTSEDIGGFPQWTARSRKAR